MASEQFSLCWDNFHKNMSSGMNSLLESEDLVDVTLAVQGKCLKAHKMVLSVCSPYFKELFKSNPCQHPIVFMKDVSYEALSDLLQFMYQGEVQVSQENLTTFIKTAEALQIKGLTGDGNGSTDNEVTEVLPEKHSVHVEEYKPTPRPKKQQQPLPAPMSSPSVKRQRLSMSSNDSQPLPPSLPPQPVTKTEPQATPQPVNIPSEPAAVHFKMEPYDSTQNLIDESGDDNFGEDTLDETVGDDTEDYSMMEGGTGEEEPQAGTSADGAGEGQEEADVEETEQTLIPEKSRDRYEKEFTAFNEWREKNGVSNIALNESTVLAYISCLAETLKASSMWTKFSMLKKILIVNGHEDISRFGKVTAFMKTQNFNYIPKKSKILSVDECRKFILEAPDDFLLYKVIIIFGLYGACRRNELLKLTIDDIEDHDRYVLIHLKEAKRSFVIPDSSLSLNPYAIYKRYAKLRPHNYESKRFFIGYRKGKCVAQPVGIHTIGGVPRKVAEFLGLSNPEDYSGHCFRRSGANMVA